MKLTILVTDCVILLLTTIEETDRKGKTLVSLIAAELSQRKTLA